MFGVFYHSVIHGLGFFICFMIIRGNVAKNNKTRFSIACVTSVPVRSERNSGRAKESFGRAKNGPFLPPFCFRPIFRAFWMRKTNTRCSNSVRERLLCRLAFLCCTLIKHGFWPIRARGVLLLPQRVSLKRTSEAALLSTEDYFIGAWNHFFLLNARNCGYGRMEDLGCAVVS